MLVCDKTTLILALFLVQEVAADVVQKLEPHDATIIFIEVSCFHINALKKKKNSMFN